jgi:hypothetical protein
MYFLYYIGGPKDLTKEAHEGIYPKKHIIYGITTQNVSSSCLTNQTYLQVIHHKYIIEKLHIVSTNDVYLAIYQGINKEII